MLVISRIAYAVNEPGEIFFFVNGLFNFETILLKKKRKINKISLVQQIHFENTNSK